MRSNTRRTCRINVLYADRRISMANSRKNNLTDITADSVNATTTKKKEKNRKKMNEHKNENPTERKENGK